MAPWNGFATAAFIALFVLPEALPAEEPASQASTAVARQLVARLEHADYAAREAAAAELAKAGPGAAGPLAAAVASGNGELAWRAAEALQQIAHRSDEQGIDQVLQAVDRAGVAGRPSLAKAMAELRARQAKLRRERAVAELQALGAIVNPSAPGQAAPTASVIALPAALDPPEPAPPPQPELDGAEGTNEPAPPPDFLPVTPPGEVPPIEGEIGDAYVGETVAIEVGGEGPVDPATAAEPTSVTSLALTAAWRGGDQGVAWLKELPELQQLNLEDAPVTDAALDHLLELPNLSLLKVRGTGITAAGLRKLHEQRPALLMTAAGDAMLGVSAQVAENKCQLVSVTPGSAAAQAGLEAGDFIVEIDDAKVVSFVDLMIAVFDRQPGDKLSVRFERAGRQRGATVELQARVTPPTLTR